MHEGIAGYRAPIEAAGYAVTRVPACETDFAALDMLSPDLLIVMGGPMGVYEADAYPWIAPEIAGIAGRIAAGRATLGVCLGSQMIAAALGAAVYRGDGPEVGFAPLTGIDPASPLAHIGDTPMLHWHGDTFDLPPGTRRLASTPRYANQAFALDDHVLALQFHGEMGEDARFEHWVEESAAMMAAAGTDAARVRADHRRHGPAAVAAGQAMLAAWLTALG